MLKPLADRVLVEVDVEESKTAGGILLPDTAQKKSQKGTVIAIYITPIHLYKQY
mgnify:CR=1 FL=1